ncbi:TIGR00341 family protein [Rapidithrix thailandica]|uniref:TIGR00341 family protein n=1 Tax=Rapidithrix thailandica TaxID=413964 RepID=A0AAW9SG35_9BACT
MRLLEIIISEQDKAEIEALLNEDQIIEKWFFAIDNHQVTLKVLTQGEYATELLLALEKQFKKYRVVIYPVEGTLPKVSPPEEKEDEKIKIGKFFTISKEELYNDIDQPVNLTVNFILMVILSSFVAGIGILKDNIAIIIGAMVIAPFLGPNMSMAFGTTLGDWPIIKKSILTGISATLVALFISILWGFFAEEVNFIAKDAKIEYQDILLALICGFAGVISIVSGQGPTLVGVMVAAALLPPLMRVGLLVGGGNYSDAFNSFLIFSTNIICLNIAGIITFYLAGIRPGRWWEKERAKKKTRNAFILWSLALTLLIITVILIRAIEE